MIDKNILAPLFRTIDKVFFGIEESDETDTKRPDFEDTDSEDEFDVERSIN